MPRCFVPGCNYGVDTYKGPHRAVFGFPLDPEKKRMWIEAIRRTDLAPTVYSQVCDRHFDPQLVQHGTEATRTVRKSDGSVTTRVVHGRSKLDHNAIPTLFLDEPLLESGPQTTQKKKRKSGTSAKKRAADGESVPEGILEGTQPRAGRAKKPRAPPPNVVLTDIGSLTAIVETPPPAPVISEKWLITLTRPGLGSGGGVIFYQFDPQSSMPVILRSLTVDSHLNAKAYYNGQQIPYLAFQSTANPTSSAYKVETWNGLVELLDTLDKYSGESYVFDFEPSDTPRVAEYGRALATLEERRTALLSAAKVEETSDATQPESAELKDPRELSKLNFIMEQIGLLDSSPNHRSYSSPLYAWTDFILRRSVEICKFLEQSGALTIPRMRLEAISLHETKVKAKRRPKINNPVVVQFEDAESYQEGQEQMDVPNEENGLPEDQNQGATVQEGEVVAGENEDGESHMENGAEENEDQVAASTLEEEAA